MGQVLAVSRKTAKTPSPERNWNWKPKTKPEPKLKLKLKLTRSSRKSRTAWSLSFSELPALQRQTDNKGNNKNRRSSDSSSDSIIIISSSAAEEEAKQKQDEDLERECKQQQELLAASLKLWAVGFFLALSSPRSFSPSFFVVRNLPKERTNGQPLTSPAFVFPFRHFVFPFNIYISLCEAGEAKRMGKQKRRLMKNAQHKRKTNERKRRSERGEGSRSLRHPSVNTASLWLLHGMSALSVALAAFRFISLWCPLYSKTKVKHTQQTHSTEYTHTHAKHTRKVS